jgi:hypothetical protein
MFGKLGKNNVLIIYSAVTVGVNIEPLCLLCHSKSYKVERFVLLHHRGSIGMFEEILFEHANTWQIHKDYNPPKFL